VHTWSGKYDYTRWQAFDLKRQTNGLSSAGSIAPTSRWRSPWSFGGYRRPGKRVYAPRRDARRCGVRRRAGGGDLEGRQG